MEEGVRRVRLLLSVRNPIDAEILTWIDTLPRTSRGTEMKAHLTTALIEYIRKERVAGEAGLAAMGAVSRAPTVRADPSAAQRRPSSDSQGALPAASGALARHLLKDFG